LTDSYDSLRFYQYPMESTLVISELREKKWRKTVVNTARRERP
jgi:CRISPR-associated protein Cas2